MSSINEEEWPVKRIVRDVLCRKDFLYEVEWESTTFSSKEELNKVVAQWREEVKAIVFQKSEFTIVWNTRLLSWNDLCQTCDVQLAAFVLLKLKNWPIQARHHQNGTKATKLNL